MAFNLDQTYTTGQDNADSVQNLRRASNNTEIVGQSFTPTLTGPLNRVEFYIKKIGTPTGNIWMEIHSDGADPTAAAQQGLDSATIDVSTISTSYDYVAFDFANINLTPGVEYWALLYGDYTLSTSNGIVVGTDTSSPSYAGGIAGRWGDGTANWEDISSYDTLFKTYHDDPPVTNAGGFFLNLI